MTHNLLLRALRVKIEDVHQARRFWLRALIKSAAIKPVALSCAAGWSNARVHQFLSGDANLNDHQLQEIMKVCRRMDLQLPESAAIIAEMEKQPCPHTLI